ncbi:MAG TPA: OsmC family protein [Burkholderiales bacterium]|nr:OsmC family protein [Burkholderiales bacterium]
MAQTDIRSYSVRARSTDTFGRVLCNARDQHFVVDGPIQNGCPGEAVGPAELFLAGVGACGVELVHVIAKEQQVPLRAVDVQIEGSMDRSKPVRSDVTVFNSVRLHFRLSGVSQAQGAELIDRFKRR